MSKKAIVLLATVMGLLVMAPAYAHHGSAGYDMSKPATIAGTVTAYNFTNPHVLISVDVKSAAGTIEKWEGELTSPNRLVQGLAGSKNTLKLWGSSNADRRACKERQPYHDYSQSA